MYGIDFPHCYFIKQKILYEIYEKIILICCKIIILPHKDW